MKSVIRIINRKRCIVTNILIVLITLLILSCTVINNVFFNKTFNNNDLNYKVYLGDTVGEINESSNYKGKFSYGPYINLKKGKYVVTVNYKESATNSVAISGSNNSFNILTAELPADKNSVTIPLNMNYDEREKGIQIETNYNGIGSFKLESLNIKKVDNIKDILLIIVYLSIMILCMINFNKSPKDDCIISMHLSTLYILLSKIFIGNIYVLFLFAIIYVIFYIYITKKNSLKSNIFKMYLIISAISFIIMFFCTKSSPFYVQNDWVDSQCYFTMGKGIFNGQIMYKDLFEQKGPLLFLIYSIGYLINNTELYGIYIIESIFLSINLICAFKISSMFLNRKYSILSIIIFPVFLLSRRYFKFGGSCEELIIPLQMISLYFFIKYLKDSKCEHDPKIMFIHGILGSCALFMKMNLTVFWVGFGLCVFLRILYYKKFKNLFKNIIALILGILLVSIPVIGYFVAVNGVKEFVDAYFIFNLKYASSGQGTNKIITLLNNIKTDMKRCIESGVIVLIGISGFTFSKSFLNVWGRVATIISSIVLFVFIYIGKVYQYYFLPISVFSLFGIIVLLYFFRYKFKFLLRNNHLFIIFVFMFLFTIFINNNYKYSKMFDKSITSQEMFSCIMHEKSEKPTLLNYAVLDSGFYTKANIFPNVRFFHKLNISKDIFPDNYTVQDKAVKNKEVQFVVYRGKLDMKPDNRYLNDNYYIIATYDQEFEGKKYRYYLYEIKHG